MTTAQERTKEHINALVGELAALQTLFLELMFKLKYSNAIDAVELKNVFNNARDVLTHVGLKAGKGRAPTHIIRGISLIEHLRADFQRADLEAQTNGRNH